MSDFSQLLQLGQQMQGRITQMQTELTQRTVTGTAGGGMVTVVVNGSLELKSVSLEDGLVAGGDARMMEDLVLSAVNAAIKKAQDMMAEEMKEVTGGMNIPGMM